MACPATPKPRPAGPAGRTTEDDEAEAPRLGFCRLSLLRHHQLIPCVLRLPPHPTGTTCPTPKISVFARTAPAARGCGNRTSRRRPADRPAPAARAKTGDCGLAQAARVHRLFLQIRVFCAKNVGVLPSTSLSRRPPAAATALRPRCRAAATTAHRTLSPLLAQRGRRRSKEKAEAAVGSAQGIAGSGPKGGGVARTFLLSSLPSPPSSAKLSPSLSLRRLQPLQPPGKMHCRPPPAPPQGDEGKGRRDATSAHFYFFSPAFCRLPSPAVPAPASLFPRCARCRRPAPCRRDTVRACASVWGSAAAAVRAARAVP